MRGAASFISCLQRIPSATVGSRRVAPPPQHDWRGEDDDSLVPVPLIARGQTALLHGRRKSRLTALGTGAGVPLFPRLLPGRGLLSVLAVLAVGRDGEVLPLSRPPEHLLQLKAKVRKWDSWAKLVPLRGAGCTFSWGPARYGLFCN